MKVLIAEDVESVAIAVKFTLHYAGVPAENIKHCSDLPNTLKYIDTIDRLDVLITDWNIPKGDEGGIIIGAVRKKFPDTFVITMTADPNNYARMVAFAPNHILPKPFEVDSFVDIIERFQKKIKAA